MPTADFVYENMKQIYPNISLGTVYRNLSLLADLGEIQKLSSFGGADRFDARTGSPLSLYVHRCGRVMDVFSEHIDKSLESIAADFKDGQISDYKARFFGICKECLKGKSLTNQLNKFFIF
ncbi:MAG: transcriptional repressor [Ruminococcus sp.]